MTIKINGFYTFNNKEYICTKISEHRIDFVAYNHKTKPTSVTIYNGILLQKRAAKSKRVTSIK